MKNMMGAGGQGPAGMPTAPDGRMDKIKPLHREIEKKQIHYQAELKIAEMELADIVEVKDFDLEKANAAAVKIEKIKLNHQRLFLLPAGDG